MTTGGPNAVDAIEKAFDLTDPAVQAWEIELIRAAIEQGLVRFDEHGAQAAVDDSIPPSVIFRVIHVATRVSKDTAPDDRRQIGINFEGKDNAGAWIRAKVSWFGGYVVVTVHKLGYNI